MCGKCRTHLPPNAASDAQNSEPWGSHVLAKQIGCAGRMETTVALKTSAHRSGHARENLRTQLVKSCGKTSFVIAW